jgi:hypothetical protein
LKIQIKKAAQKRKLIAPIAPIEETTENFEPTGVEYTPEGVVASADPYDPELIRVDPKMFSLRQILDMIDEGDLELAPDFQRLKVWRPEQKSRLIESVLLRIPLPAFYFSSDEKGKLQVVDGLQRLSTIHDFVRGGPNKSDYFALDNLEYLQRELGGKKFNQIQDSVWTRRINNTQIIANVIDPQTPLKVKFDIFRRINTGGSPLNPQEIRHCLSGPKARKLLKEMTSLPAFKKATRRMFENSIRMVDREVALRFVAFYKSPGLKKYSDYETMDDFLNRANQNIESDSKEALENILDKFAQSMENNRLVFGDHAFSKWAADDEIIRPFNRALFDCWSVCLADLTKEKLKENKMKIVLGARKVMAEDKDFFDAITAGTGDINKVNTRFRTVKQIVTNSL